MVLVDAEREEGRRERRKRLTREAISAAAMRLFAERGFDAVTVAEIAEAADVAEKTVYNYFAHKAALFFDEGDLVLAELLFTLRNRAAGQSALDAVQTFVAGRAEWAAGRRPARPTRQFRRLIAESPALQVARRQMFVRYESAVAGLLAAETGAAPGSAEPFVAAVALVAVVRAAFEASAADGQAAHHGAAAGLRLLRNGLGGYAIATRR